MAYKSLGLPVTSTQPSILTPAIGMAVPVAAAGIYLVRLTGRYTASPTAAVGLYAPGEVHGRIVARDSYAEQHQSGMVAPLPGGTDVVFAGEFIVKAATSGQIVPGFASLTGTLHSCAMEYVKVGDDT